MQIRTIVELKNLNPITEKIEVKAIKTIDEVHFAQCLNYLKATGLRLCLLLNFGKTRLEFKRLVL